MKLFAFSTAAALLVTAGAATAARPGQNQAQQPQQQFRNTLNAMVLNGSAQNGEAPPGQSTRPDDPDQGDDNAARRAILEVCFKNTSAAQRSAICDGEPISPE